MVHAEFKSGDVHAAHDATACFRCTCRRSGRPGSPYYILDPSADVILERLLPLHLVSSTYRALVENAAAEQGARRTAMKSATDNAGRCS